MQWFSYLSAFVLSCCSVIKLCPTFWNPTDCSILGFPVLHHFPDIVQAHVHWVGDAVQPFHPLSSPSPPTFNLSQHQDLFQWVLFTSGGQSIGASASVLAMNVQDWFPLGGTGWISLPSKGLSRVSSNTTVQKHQFFNAQLYGSALTSIHDYWKNHSFD